MHCKYCVVVVLVILMLFGCESGASNSILREPVIIVDDAYSVEEDYYKAFKIDVTKTSDLTIDIVSKSSVNFEILIFDKIGYLQWENNETDNTTVFLQEIVASNGSHYSTLSMSEGEYYFVVDNTDYGVISPPFNFVSDDVICELTLTVE